MLELSINLDVGPSTETYKINRPNLLVVIIVLIGFSVCELL